ncbi:MAG: type II secretion system protein [Limisphaerales bacterium]
MTPRGPASSRRAFSLVELLVVIGILGVLAGMLLPGLSRGRGLAQATACLGHLREIGIALQIYVADNDNRMPSMRDQAPGEAGMTNPPSATVILPGPEKGLSNVLADKRVFRCPADRSRVFERTGSSYSWNSLLNGQDADRLKVLSLDLSAGQVPVFFDKEGFHAVRGERRAVNFLYADGHIGNLLVWEGAR